MSTGSIMPSTSPRVIKSPIDRHSRTPMRIFYSGRLGAMNICNPCDGLRTTIRHWIIFFVLMAHTITASGMPVLSDKTSRPLRYHPEGTDFVIENGPDSFNRPLYGGNTAFRVDLVDCSSSNATQRHHQRQPEQVADGEAEAHGVNHGSVATTIASGNSLRTFSESFTWTAITSCGDSPNIASDQGNFGAG
jgi:hypothetical protein